MNKKTTPERIQIEATTYPDFDYVINQLMRLADKVNEIIQYLEEEEKLCKTCSVELTLVQFGERKTLVCNNLDCPMPEYKIVQL